MSYQVILETLSLCNRTMLRSDSHIFMCDMAICTNIETLYFCDNS